MERHGESLPVTPEEPRVDPRNRLVDHVGLVLPTSITIMIIRNPSTFIISMLPRVFYIKLNGSSDGAMSICSVEEE